MVDFHIHTAPSLVPRHHDDLSIGALLAGSGIDTFVLKAHEGSTAERALLAGGGAVGSIVLNSPVGGANPDAVKVAAAYGARVVWLPTISSPVHQEAAASPELKAHDGVRFATVPVTSGGAVLPEWTPVFDEVAAADMVLAAGHVSMDEAVAAFRVAKARGVQRFLVNHPLMPFLGWRAEHVDELVALGAYIEVGVLADLLGGTDGETPTQRLATQYPASLIVFGSDLGHQHYPDVVPGITDWLDTTASTVTDGALDRITTTNGKELLTR
ncbi:MAG TPA: DUF6282 family protein [Jatrophihabitantaceae bacterium]|jgi:hypothetical protein|nr:DUF6282 family protein [Jatrophihabitantaceae bacterium]